jgi:amino acid transporter
VVYNIYDYFKNGNLNFGNLPTIIEFLIFIIAIIFYFFEKMQFNVEKPIYLNIVFWISVGLFVYFTGNFFYILLVENSNNASNEVKNQLKVVYSFVTILKNLLLSIALLHGSETKSEQNNQYIFPEDLHLDDFTPNQNTTN